MTGTLAFDEQAALRIERAYLTPDIVAQRAVVLEQLAVVPGESVLDIGIGPGLLAQDLAQATGSQGCLLGVDTSDAMVGMTRRRCAELPWARFEMADACELPCEDEEFDCATSTQVYEYVADMPKALKELHRVLVPGGRALILDTDYDSLVLHEEAPELTARVLRSWDEHFVHRGLPRELGGLLRRAGFEVEAVRALPLLNTEYRRDTFSFGLLSYVAAFARGRDDISEEEASSWIAGFEELGRRGEYFFSLNRYLFLARKPHSSG